MNQNRHRAIVHTTAPYEDARRGVGLAIARVAVASAVALIAIGLVGYSVVVVVRATTWPLRYPVGRLVGLTGLDGLNGWDWDRVFDALGALASSLMVEGVVALGVVGLLLLLFDLRGPIGFVPDRIVDTVSTFIRSRGLPVRVIGFAVAVFLVWSAYATFLLLFPG